MPKLVFEGETHEEIVAQMGRWLASEGAARPGDGPLSAAHVVEQGAELTKDALRIIAGAAPEQVASNEIVKALTEMGYKATDATKERLVSGLGQLEEMTGGSVLRTVSEKVSERGRNAVYEMNVTIAKQILKQLHGV